MTNNSDKKSHRWEGKPGIVFFPVCLLKKVSEDVHSACYDILCFAGYDHARHYNKGEDIGNRMYYAGKNKMGFIFQDSEKDYYRGEELYLNVEYKFPKVNIEVNRLISMLGSDNSDFDVACFLAYCALRSIIQTDIYKAISIAFLLSRMSGSATTIKGVFDENRKINPDKLPERLAFLSKRYWIEKLKTELQYQYKVTVFSAKHYHKTYYSFHLNINDLKKQADNRRNIAKLKDEEKEGKGLSESKPETFSIPGNSKNTEVVKRNTWEKYKDSVFKIPDKVLSNLASLRQMIDHIEYEKKLFKNYEDRERFTQYWGEIMINGENKYARRYETVIEWNIAKEIKAWHKQKTKFVSRSMDASGTGIPARD